MPMIPALGVAGSIALYSGVASTVVGIGGSLISAGQQASAMQAQAEAAQAQAVQAQQIANYNAEIQRQNAMVAYQMAQYQAQSNQQLALFNQAAAINNQNLAMVQAQGAQNQYEQGLLNAKQKEIEGEAVRAQGMEEQRRARQENALRIGALRSKMGASGVTFEGTNLELLADAANIGETAVQDMVYATELSSRKTFREAEITKWQAGFSLLDKYGYDVQAQNYKNQALRYSYEGELYGYESALAGANYKIDLNQARLTELSGKAEANALEFQAAQYRQSASASLIGGAFGAVGTGLKGVSGVMDQWPTGGSGAAGAGTPGSFTASFGGAKTGYYG